eukprot:CAMPEP_0194345600 /NCGR_PEP_ID=MMETSP0171-20130528/104949_1 /TAXON_ID=218684 /ORGANISM="Corethron pennatum, Strain L29A3" /LENGTH=783 /DNA_ID=CAMNT_0039112609 /DNA_START=54 /DNA_END=2405 /DNA_ORIENTATION=-
MGKNLYSCANLLLLLVPASVLGFGRFSYDENDDSRGPDNWKLLDDVKNNYWQKFHLVNVDKNECGDEGSEQSPVNLKRTTKCKGDHHMLYKYGSCKIDDVDFKIEPWGLEGHYPRHGRGCDAPNLNIADSFHRRAAARFDLKIPSEHTMDGKRYDAEFYVAHVENTEKKNNNNRGNLVAMTSVLFYVDGNKKNEWLEELIDGWEEVAEKEKRRCSGVADSSLVKASVAAPTNNRYIGCFKDKEGSRMFSYEAQSRDASTEKCAKLCEGYRYFARQFKGQCFCGDRDDFDRHGSSGSCNCEGSNVGRYVACVYDTSSVTPPVKAPVAVPTTAPVATPSSYTYAGCYKDKKGSRMFSSEAQSRDASTEKCAKLCEGYRYFARQFKGQCFCGDQDDYGRHGSSGRCNCEGSNVGKYVACVYDTSSVTPPVKASVTVPTSMPSYMPFQRPTTGPHNLPSLEPTATPSMVPLSLLSGLPTTGSSNLPSMEQTVISSIIPSSLLSGLPTTRPSNLPSLEPTVIPSMVPSSQPSGLPTTRPSNFPSLEPAARPSMFPSSLPSGLPTLKSSSISSQEPTYVPTADPTYVPSTAPSATPPRYTYQGCYKDKEESRMFSSELQSSGASTDNCATLCRGYRYFARQFKGQCFCGNRDDYDRHGSSRSCNCAGSNVGGEVVGGYVACVYEIESERRNRRLKKKDWHLHAPFKTQHYYSYQGSLTMPPCSNSVFWYIMNDKQQMSTGQLQRLKNLIAGYRDTSCRFGTYADRNGSVARPLQSSSGRSIFQCTKKDY